MAQPFRSTHNPQLLASLLRTTIQPVPEGGGLWVPIEIKPFEREWFARLHDRPWQETAVEVLSRLTAGEIPVDVLESIVPILPASPVVQLKNQDGADTGKYILELFHGPTMAFKDFGALFMARTTSYLFSTEEGKKNATRPRVLVATSGDTGGAVANAFAGTATPVCVLFPSGRISDFQKAQICRCGPGVAPIVVDGSFDDCQRIVKEGLNQVKGTLSANSINLLRLVAQALYYFDAVRQLGPLDEHRKPIVFVVPSGNMGNGTACLLAMKLGLPVDRLVLATNSNDSLPRMLSTGDWKPQQTVETLSTAMDVGNPSNFFRLQDMTGGTVEGLREILDSDSATDEQVVEAMKKAKAEYGYVADPHTCVGLSVLDRWISTHSATGQSQGTHIVLSTAHPYKFDTVVREGLADGSEVEQPSNLQPWKFPDSSLRLVGNDFVKILNASRIFLAGDAADHDLRVAVAESLKSKFEYEIASEIEGSASSSVVLVENADGTSLQDLSRKGALALFGDLSIDVSSGGSYLAVRRDTPSEAIAWALAALLPRL